MKKCARWMRPVLGLAGSLGLTLTASATNLWWRVFEEDFATDPSSRWSYTGVSNAAAQALFRHDALNQRMQGEWDQGNAYSWVGDPQTIRPSRCTAPLDRVLTDRDTFRFGATIRIEPGSIPDTTEFYQIANFGLYDLAPGRWGDDRGQADNYSGNTTLIRDANGLIEFNYFINNRSYGFNPFMQGTLIAAMPEAEVDSTAFFVTGASADPYFHDTDMGSDTYLPVGTNLYMEVYYQGATTGDVARRVHCGIYTEPERTNLLVVGGVPMYYWTQPATGSKHFAVSSFGLLNWAAANWGGANGTGTGSYDDVYADVLVREGALVAVTEAGLQPVFTWAAVSGTTYRVVSATALDAAWTTSMTVYAAGSSITLTGAPAGAVEFLALEPVVP